MLSINAILDQKYTKTTNHQILKADYEHMPFAKLKLIDCKTLETFIVF